MVTRSTRLAAWFGAVGLVGFAQTAPAQIATGQSDVHQSAAWRAAGGPLFVEPLVMDRTELPDEPLQALDDNPPYEADLNEAAARHNLDPKLLRALVLAESGFQPRAISSAGAAGLTQLMPQTARELGVADRLDPVQSLQGGARYLAQQLARFGDVRLALAAYNAGPGRVARLGRVPPIRETEVYVDTVVDCYLALTAGRSVHSTQACATPRVQP